LTESAITELMRAMYGDSRPKNVGFVAYIDEAGDPGIRGVQPVDPKGASEWFIVSAVVVRAENDPKSVEWVRQLRTDLRLNQGPQLHYKTLNATRRLAVCERLAKLDCRIFVVASHKPNMNQYRNDRAAKVGGQMPFYNWCTRVLLERVTAYCHRRAMTEWNEPRFIRLDLSRAGGLNYDQLIAYHEYLRRQTNPVLSAGKIEWDMLHPDLYRPVESHLSAGVQIADIAASAFYQAAHSEQPNWDVKYAKALGPRLARAGRTVANHGLVLMPFQAKLRQLNDSQRTIFEHYGFEL
jgi:hypothetical protein